MLQLLNHYGGKALMVIGVLLLLVCYLTHYESNGELIAGLAFVISGVVLHVFALKSEQKY